MNPLKTLLLSSLLSYQTLCFPIATVVLASNLVACSSAPQNARISQGSLVIALGDSLTFGYGASPSTAYPQVLTELSTWQVKNEGINGNTSEDVLQRLDSIIAQQPKLVLLGIGGNDVLRRVSPQVTEDNLNQIIQRLKSANIPVVLIAEPHFSASALFGKASDNPVYEKVAKQHNIPLFADEWSAILSDDKLKSDQIHANAQGYRRFAENLYQFLKQQGFA